MRIIVQRVSHSSVKVDGNTVGSIQKGLLLLIGFTHCDDEKQISWMARKVAGLRIFEDEENRMNLSLKEVGGSALAISQFTLYADSRKGRRPSFVDAAPPEIAEPLYSLFCESLINEGIPVEKGIFGAKMDVELLNDGPVTIILER